MKYDENILFIDQNDVLAAGNALLHSTYYAILGCKICICYLLDHIIVDSYILFAKYF